MKLSFSIVGLLLASVLALHAEDDIIEQAASHPRGVEQVQQSDGSYKTSKYGDHLLAEAEDFLSAQHPRPWTVPKVLSWVHETTDPATLTHLLRLLAASRDSKAALCLSDYLPSTSLAVRMAAYYGLYDYFVPPRTDVGGTEDVIRVVREWVAANKDRLQ